MNQALEKVESYFQEAVALETEAQRADYLSRACPDPALRREVESLLACHQNPDRIFAEDTVRTGSGDDKAPEGHDLFVGKTLDGKYHLEQLLGQGGMGAVYLSTHLGTGRSVAVKLITPQFMRNPEFVVRFKREARAAGRLRHPNIVDVTDFGVARCDGESVAYLVMEYLDGCTLGEVLAEEKRLPLHWVVDILEQVCSAVQEAHQQGIVHRDLKPANIWLEPATLGGYRAKVLDFGIAKLAEDGDEVRPVSLERETTRSLLPNPGDDEKTLVSRPESEIPTSRWVAQSTPSVETRNRGGTDPISTTPTGALTEVGAIMGTPAFMSPEQCRGEALDARSDIYSLGIIAYQMLSGTTPFTGDLAAVLRAHQEAKPRSLSRRDRKLPKAVARVVMSALEKDPAARPQTAMAFAHALRANTEDLGTLYRRAFALFSEYFPKVMALSLLAHIPVFLVTALMVGLRLADPWLGRADQIGFGLVFGLLKGAAGFLTGSAISGVIAILVTQLAVAPLKPVTLSTAVATLRGHWRPFLRTGLLATVRILIGFLLIVPGLVLMVRYALWAPVVLLEGSEKMAALQRSRVLVARSWRTAILAVVFQALVPVLVTLAVTRLAGLGKTANGNGGSVRLNVVSELITLTSIFVLPLVSIVLALVYLKARQLAGEEMTQLTTRIEEAGTGAKWEQRMRARLGSGG